MSEDFYDITEKGIAIDQEAYYRQFDDAFLEALRAQLPEARGIDALVLERRDALVGASQHLIVDEASRLNLRFGAIVIASHQLLRDKVPAERLRHALHTALNQPSRQAVFDGTRAMLDHSPDPFRAIVDTSKAREQSFFGLSFGFERPQDDEHAYLVNVTRCLWHEFFREQGVPELMPILCAFDLSYMDAVKPEKDGFRIERPTTLGWGHDRCRFWMIRTDAKPDEG
jgi:L-2-amino-thiazoline-4-carboxylic acid hydrolase